MLGVGAILELDKFLFKHVGLYLGQGLVLQNHFERGEEVAPYASSMEEASSRSDQARLIIRGRFYNAFRRFLRPLPAIIFCETIVSTLSTERWTEIRAVLNWRYTA